MRALAPACPPNERQSSTTTRRPSEARVNGGRQPGRSGADHDHVDRARRARRASSMPRQRPSASSEGLSSTEPLGQTTQHLRPSAAPCCSNMRGRGVIVLGVDDVMRVGCFSSGRSAVAAAPGDSG